MNPPQLSNEERVNYITNWLSGVDYHTLSSLTINCTNAEECVILKTLFKEKGWESYWGVTLTIHNKTVIE